MKKMTWLDFILKNFKAGTVKQISEHITKCAREQNFNPDNNNVDAKVRQILPAYTDGRFKPTTTSRKLLGKIFYYDQNTKIYYLASDLIQRFEVIDHSFESKAPTVNKEGINTSETITYERIKDLSTKHRDLVKLVHDYAIDQGYEVAAESRKYKNIDVLTKKDDKYTINEIKTYKNSIYVAVGQVQFYKYELLTDKTLGIKEENIAALNIVGDFQIDSKFEEFLKSLNINYVNVKELNI